VNGMVVKFLDEIKGSEVPELESKNSPEDENMHIPVLEVKNVHKRFGRLYVLKGVDFKVNRGEVVGITGENGSGKSTLLKIIVGLLSCDQGKVRLRGAFGYCPQDLLLFDDLTMEENIARARDRETKRRKIRRGEDLGLVVFILFPYAGPDMNLMLNAFAGEMMSPFFKGRLPLPLISSPFRYVPLVLPSSHITKVPCA
jgi:hypothetical protein